MKEHEFEGKVAFVTGATSGIGRACALGFARGCARVACIGRNATALQKVGDEIKNLGTEVLTVQADLQSTQKQNRR
jgi:NADP-dependent 3-hydroxy acid dehydrogenase YdfG